MGQITALETQKKKTDRVSVFIDNEFAFGISAELAFLNKLKTSQELTSNQIKELIQKDQVERLLNKSLRFLGFRPRSEKEIKDHLTYKGKLKDLETEEEKQAYLQSIDQVIEKLRELKYVNDTQFASWWIKERGEARKISERVLKSELFMKGIDKEIVLEALKSTESEEDKAQKIGEKKARLLGGLPKDEFRNKMGQFLARKGFGWETIKKVVDSYKQKD